MTISYSDYHCDSQLDLNVRTDITYHTTTVGADGYFELAIPTQPSQLAMWLLISDTVTRKLLPTKS